MKKITTKEFIEAVKVVENYSKQLKQTILKAKTPLTEFIKIVTPHLRNGLEYNDIRVYNAIKSSDFEYIEDIDEKSFLKLRNVGVKCLPTFELFKKFI